MMGITIHEEFVNGNGITWIQKATESDSMQIKSVKMRSTVDLMQAAS